MLYHLLYPFHTELSVLNVTRYITFRTAIASLTALAISLLLGPWMIRKLREAQIGQVIRAEGPATHQPKAGTPTMGGLLILIAALTPTLLWADLTNPYIWIAILSTIAFGAVGFVDDYLKISRQSHHGLRSPDWHRRGSRHGPTGFDRRGPLQHEFDLSVLQGLRA